MGCGAALPASGALCTVSQRANQVDREKGATPQRMVRGAALPLEAFRRQK
jgi:hypothetical protein